MKARENKSQKQPSNDTSQKFTTPLDVVRAWTPERIRHSLELKGYSLASLSREHGFHESACRKALRHPWPKVERVIAECLGVSCPSELFPDRYDEHGYPLKYSKHLGNSSASKASSAAHGDKDDQR